jgi:unsaturated rhamnogalacturonyl hydrolase
LKAYHGIRSKISEDGSVKDVSAGTAVMKTREDYCKIPHKRVQGWGQGLALVFLSGLLEYVETGRD